MCLSVVFFMIPVLGIHQASWICVFIVVVQSLSHVQLFVPPWTAAHRASLSFTVSPSLLKFMSLESVMLSNHLIICHPLLLLPSIFPSMGSFPMSQLFASGGQSIGASTSASVFPMNIQKINPTDFPLGKGNPSVFIIFIKFWKISTTVSSSIFLPLCFQGLQIHVY